jgi:hypothetical protein
MKPKAAQRLLEQKSICFPVLQRKRWRCNTKTLRRMSHRRPFAETTKELFNPPARARLALVECKLEKINLQDVSQLLGYSKVALPLASIIISPEGISDSINLLFNVHRRDDILSYGQDGCIRIARWIESKKDIDMHTLIPKGILL